MIRKTTGILVVVLVGYAANVIAGDLGWALATPQSKIHPANLLNIPPSYVVQEGQKYGYKTNSGNVVMLSYLGSIPRTHTYEFLFDENNGDQTVYIFSDPFRLIKAYTFHQGMFVEGRVYINPVSITPSGDTVFSIFDNAKYDAGKAYLKRYKNSDNKNMWVPDDGLEVHIEHR